MSACLGLTGLSMLERLAGVFCIGVACLPLSEGCAATFQASPFRAPSIAIELLLDISPSMEIGATPGDIAAMMHLTPCSVPGAVPASGHGHFPFGATPPSGQIYMAYQCKLRNDADGRPSKFDGLACPIPAARGVAGSAVMAPSMEGPRCADGTPPAAGAQAQQLTTAGAPCAFACHWDTTHTLDATRDYYGLARSTIGQPPCYQKNASLDGCGITLRLDLVKNAMVGLIGAMQEDSFRGTADFSVGVFTFDNDLHPVYPIAATCGLRGRPNCQAGQDWPLALASVGTAPDLPNQPDAGIQPTAAHNGGATDLPNALTTLAKDYLTDAGVSATPESRSKNLFLITDGLDDRFQGARRYLEAIDANLCQIYKSMGYQVFVLYTPYYPLMNAFYLSNVSHVVEGSGPGTLAYNLRRCASDPIHNFIEASPTDATSISRALQTFLARAMKGV